MKVLTPYLVMIGILVWPGMGSADTPSMPVDVIFYDPIEDNNFASRGWVDNTTQTLSGDGAIVGSTRSIDWTWQAGQTIPPNGASMRYNLTPTDNVYLRYYVKYSANWVGSGVSYHPHTLWFLTTKSGQFSGPYGSALTLYVEQNNSKFRLAYANPANVDGVFYDSPPFSKDRWYKIEAFFKLNTIVGGVGQNDGIFKLWTDGVLVVDADDVMVRTGSANADMLIDQFSMAPYIKPVSAPGSPITQTMWIDELTIGTENPNAVSSIPNPPSSVTVN